MHQSTLHGIRRINSAEKTSGSTDPASCASFAAAGRIQKTLLRLLPLLCFTFFAGCEGKSLQDDNPVLTEAPPRLKDTNRASEAQDESHDSVIRAVGHSTSTVQLTGNTVVAEVNGSPIFVDDLIGSMRLSLDADEKLSEEEKQSIMYRQVRARLDAYVDQEIVLQALYRRIPEDRRGMIEDSLEEPFQEVIGNIKKDNNVETDAELNKVLATQGLSVDLLRESFIRIQMVQGFLSSSVEISNNVDRIELVEYYDQHHDDFTTKDRVRAQEIVVNFAEHGGEAEARSRMGDAIRELQQGADFAQVAVKYSDALSAEKRGDIGWIYRGSLADKDVEQRLFELPVEGVTKVYEHDDRFEIYRVLDREDARTEPFQEVQKQIEQRILAERKEKARSKVMEDLRTTSTVVSMFDEESAIE